MVATNDGGPAFPLPVAIDHMDGVNYGKGGMSLRDYFAAHALVGALTADLHVGEWQELAASCYRIADAMLAARGGR